MIQSVTKRWLIATTTLYNKVDRDARPTCEA